MESELGEEVQATFLIDESLNNIPDSVLSLMHEASGIVYEDEVDPIQQTEEIIEELVAIDESSNGEKIELAKTRISLASVANYLPDFMFEPEALDMYPLEYQKALLAVVNYRLKNNLQKLLPVSFEPNATD